MDQPFITVTGIDERTDLGLLEGLGGVEIGILYSATPEGRNRYPRKKWIVNAVHRLPRVAIHICGRKARQELSENLLHDLVGPAKRIQINGGMRRIDLYSFCVQFERHTIITQHNRANDHLLSYINAPNHAILIDASGGRGIAPKDWTRPDTPYQVGYAGGLGPENLSKELKRIRQTSAGSWWVDMESSLRVNDWFSVEKAKEAAWTFYSAMTIFHPIQAQSPVASGEPGPAQGVTCKTSLMPKK